MSELIWQLAQRIMAVFGKIELAFAWIFRPLWRLAQRIWEFVGPSRFSAVTVLAGLILLVATDQGRELAARVGDDDSPSFFWLILGVEWLAVQAWYWARIVLPVGVPEAGSSDGLSDGERRWRRWIPRIYAGVAFSAASISLYLAGRNFHAWIMLFIGVITITFFYYRQGITARLQRASPSFSKMTRHKTTGDGIEGSQFAPLTWVMLLASVFVALAAMVVVSILPLQVGQTFGATAIAFFAFGNLIPIGSYLVMRSIKAGFPVITTLLIAAVVFSWWNDNHQVPLVEEEQAASTQRMPLKAALEHWKDKNSVSDEVTVPLVLVSSAGGGLRAAYWTGTVLGALQDACPHFARSTFSISSVSGGSVGASVFAAHLANTEISKHTKCRADAAGHGQHSTFVSGVLSKDFLGPTVAAMLFSDFLQRFLPIGFLPDRGEALSNAWAKAWNETCTEFECAQGSINALSKPFLSYQPWMQKNWQPALLLNSTHQESGKRFISGHITVERNVFFDAFDANHVLKNDIALKTAALNSARFTYVSPAGRLVSANGEELGHVLDGGYFENYGAVTTAEVLLNIVELLDDLRINIQPIVIQITSDPGLTFQDQPRRAKGFLEVEGGRARLANEVAGPLRGILATRVARGVLASKTVAEIVDLLEVRKQWFPNVHEPVFAHFELCKVKGESDPPLGWAMSAKTREVIQGLLRSTDEKCNNAAELKKVIDALNSAPVGPSATP